MRLCVAFKKDWKRKVRWICPHTTGDLLMTHRPLCQAKNLRRIFLKLSASVTLPLCPPCMEIESNGMVPFFLGTQLLNRSSHVENKVHVKLTNTGLLLHYKSHLDVRYKRALLRPTFDRAFRLSSNWSYFSEECDRLKLLFSQLKYPDKLINSTISRFIATKATEQPVSSPAAVSDSSDPVRVILPFKDQSSADIVRRQLQDLSRKIHTTVSPVFVSQKIGRDLKMREAKPPLVNQPCLVYKFECDHCDAGYVGYTSRHLHQRIEDLKSASSSIC